MPDALKVLYLPGVLGSELSFQEGNADHLVWVDLGSLLEGGIAWLQLADDGVSPGVLAGGKQLVSESILGAVYAPLAQYISLLGYQVLALGWDWRKSHLATAQAVWPQVRAWLGSAPLRIVAHSAGGILARCLFGQMLAAGVGGQLARLVTIGTPHYGSLEPVRMWWRRPTLYRALASIIGWTARGPGAQGPAYLDDVLASHPSWYELMAFAASGPLFTAYPAQAAQIYTAGFYSGANAYISPGSLLNAELVQGELAAWLPTGVMQSIAGVGEETAFALDPRADPSTEEGWQYTQQGDGLVTVAQASPAGVPVTTVPVAHGLQPLHPLVWALVAAMLV